MLMVCRDPESLPAPDFSFQDIVREGARPSPTRIAWSGDLGGISPSDPEVAQICQRATFWFGSHGASVSQACPDLTNADFIFQVEDLLGNSLRFLDLFVGYALRNGVAVAGAEGRRV